MNSPPEIEALLPQICSSLAKTPNLVLQAPPGAGKTTRVPLALLNADWLAGKKILLLEPRRLAASNAAHFMASQLGEEIGETVGYSIRYQRKVSRKTKLEVVTEGILTRRLQKSPDLTGVGLVIFDEFHERHLQSDLALALCRDIQQGIREDLRLLVMSATLDAAPVAELLDAPVLTSAGHAFPVDISYLPASPQQRLTETAAAAIRRIVKETSGDLLVFLPGEGEIRRCQAQLSDLAQQLHIRPLYGNLPFREQEQAILPGPQRKIVLATNIAETSLTIEGISVVVDSGYCRRPRHDAAAGGLTRLDLVRISQASATQRAGRAGRLGPGKCYRLWSEGTQGALLPFNAPEITTADLASLCLELYAWGVSEPELLSWLDPPPKTAWQTAKQVLQQLGALNDQQQLTGLGRQMAELPTHPRLAALLLSAKQMNLLDLGCDLVALLSEPDPWRRSESTIKPSDCDLLDRLEDFWRRLARQRLEQFTTVARGADYWRRHFDLPPARSKSPQVSSEQTSLLLATAFPERIGKVRPETRRYLLASGQGVQLSPQSALQSPTYLVAVELRGGRGPEPEVCLASSFSRELLEQRFPDLPWTSECRWDRASGRVLSVQQQRFGELVIQERPAQPSAEELAGAVIQGIREEGLQILNWTATANKLRARLNFLHRALPEEGWPDLSEETLLAELEDWLLPFLGGIRSRAQLSKLDLLPVLRSLLDWQQQQRVDSLAPEVIQVPSGSKIKLQYPHDAAPVLAVKLQEMFGQLDTPRIVAGKIAVQIHLLSPAGRPLQVTQDLRHFWSHNYQEVKKEMKGRYPKHPWPDDPVAATATAKTKRRN